MFRLVDVMPLLLGTFVGLAIEKSRFNPVAYRCVST